MTDREQILDLWASGATASEIAGELGVSRENVKSVVKRARAKGDLRAVRHGAPSRRTIVAWVDQAVAPALARAGVSLVNCRPGCCRWPVSQDQRGHLFCDAPTEPGKRPQWCAAHRAIGFRARAA